MRHHRRTYGFKTPFLAGCFLVAVLTGNFAFADEQFGDQQVITNNVLNPNSVYTADLDGDGDADVLSANTEKIVWYKNQGDGNFGSQQVITTEIDAGEAVYAADLDDDGDSDVLSYSTNDEKMAWYENQGDGTFGEQVVLGVHSTEATEPQSVYAPDLDGDGDADVLDSGLNWYENQGDGTFGNRQVISTGDAFSEMAYPEDLDGDGNVDVVCASGVWNDIIWYENQGDGTFGEEQVILENADIEAQSLYAADINGDGDTDVLAALSESLGERIVWYENQGDGTFGEEQVITTNVRDAYLVYATDVDGDGNADVLSAFNPLTRGDKIAWYENQGGGSFGEQQIIAPTGSNVSLDTTDLDGDGDTDVIAGFDADGSSGSDGDTIAWYENQRIAGGDEYTVTFDLGEHGTRVGGGALEQTVAEGNDAVEPEIETDEGWVHTGWDTDFTNVTSDLTVVAQYEEAVAYEVTFDLGEHGTRVGGGELEQTVAEGNDAVEPEIRTDQGWAHAGWNTDFTTITSDVTVTAQYSDIVQDATTMGDDTVKLFFSEAIENDNNEIGAAVANDKLGIEDASGNFVPFDKVTTGKAGTSTTDGQGDLNTFYLHMTSPEKKWNADATATSPGQGTDDTGTHRENVPAVNIKQGGLEKAGDGTEVNSVNYTATTDGAPPAVIKAEPGH